MPPPALTSSRILPISSCFPGSSRPQFHPCLLLPPMLGSRGMGWWSPSGLPHPISTLKRPVLLLRTTPSPLCWAPGQVLDWQAVAMGTSQGHWCRNISSSHLFRVVDTPGPSTLHLLTEGLAGTLQGGVCVWVIGLNPDHIRCLLSAFTSQWSEPQKPPSSNSWGLSEFPIPPLWAFPQGCCPSLW